jgi:hypothetical protein
MTDYPEHDKLALVKDETQAAGEFVEWLGSQGIHLMVWREDLTDQRVTDTECPKRVNSDDPAPCNQLYAPVGDTATPRAWWRRHCLHWQNPER